MAASSRRPPFHRILLPQQTTRVVADSEPIFTEFSFCRHELAISIRFFDQRPFCRLIDTWFFVVSDQLIDDDATNGTGTEFL